MAKDLVDSVFFPGKLFSHLRMTDWLRGKLVYPITHELGPSGPGNCNNACPMCLHGSYYNTKATMAFETYKRLMDELTSYEAQGLGEDVNARGMIFSSSGEPTMNPRILDFIEYTKSKRVDLALITNGSNWRRIDGLAETVLKHVSWTRTSLDAGSNETRRKTHGVGDYDKVIESLGMLAEAKKRMGSECQIGAQITVSEDNWMDIIQATNDVSKVGIDYFQIKPVVYHAKDPRGQLPREFWEKVLPVAETAERAFDRDDFKVWVKYDQFGAIMKSDHDKGAYTSCLAHIWPVIEADGRVFHCSQTRGMPEFEIGDLNKQTFKEIWESKKRQEINEGIKVEECTPVCRCHWDNKVLNSVRGKKHAPNFT